MQNPVNTPMWLMANVELVAPIISLAVDTKLFVEVVFRGPLLLLTAVYACLATAGIMAGPAKHGNIFRLYRLSQLFRFQSEAFVVGQTMLYLALITLTHYGLKHYFRRKVMPS